MRRLDLRPTAKELQSVGVSERWEGCVIRELTLKEMYL